MSLIKRVLGKMLQARGAGSEMAVRVKSSVRGKADMPCTPGVGKGREGGDLSLSFSLGDGQGGLFLWEILRMQELLPQEVREPHGLEDGQPLWNALQTRKRSCQRSERTWEFQGHRGQGKRDFGGRWGGPPPGRSSVMTPRSASWNSLGSPREIFKQWRGEGATWTVGG